MKCDTSSFAFRSNLVCIAHPMASNMKLYEQTQFDGQILRLRLRMTIAAVSSLCGETSGFAIHLCRDKKPIYLCCGLRAAFRRKEVVKQSQFFKNGQFKLGARERLLIFSRSWYVAITY